MITIIGADGNDSIIIGTEGTSYQETIFAAIDVQAGGGTGDTLIVHDGGSDNNDAAQIVRPVSIQGIQKDDNST